MDPQEPQQPPPFSGSPPPSAPPPYTAPPSAGQQIDVQAMIKGLALPDWLILGGALAFLIVSFFPWYGFSYHYSILGATYSNSGSVDAWNYWAGWLAGLISLLVLVLAGVFMAARAGTVKLPVMAVSDKIILMAGGALMLLLSIIYLAVAGSNSVSGPGYSVGPSIGVFLGILASIAVIAGGFLKPDATN